MIENMSVFVRRFFVEFDRCEALLRLSLAESAVRRSFVPSVVASWTNMSGYAMFDSIFPCARGTESMLALPLVPVF